MQNVFGKIECPSCHQYKLQPVSIGLFYVGLFFTIASSFIRYLPFHLDNIYIYQIMFSGIGILFILIYLALLLTHKMNYICKNCGKIYSYNELKDLAQKQNIKLPGTAKPFLISFGVMMLVAAVIIGGVLFYSTTGNSAKSINNINQDVPKGNAHWDKAEALFQQIRNEKDPDKVKQLDAQIVTELKAVLQEQPNNPRVWSELGDAYSWVSGTGMGGDPEVRLAAYQKAEELDPNNFVYINGVGDQLITMGRYNDAILELQKAVRIGGNDYTYLSLVQAYRGAKIYDQARQNYQKAIDGFSSHNSGGKYDTQILQAQQEMAALPK